MSFTWTERDASAVDLARILAADAVEKAGNGHPGTPMGLAPVGYTLWSRFLRYHPEQPDWPNRDRFVLSVGHASMLLYSLLHFYGYGLTMDDIKQFRQDGSLTPGHPEYGLTPGIEMTTGPLGQGFASAIGFAYGQRFQRGAAVFGRFFGIEPVQMAVHFRLTLESPTAGHRYQFNALLFPFLANIVQQLLDGLGFQRVL